MYRSSDVWSSSPHHHRFLFFCFLHRESAAPAFDDGWTDGCCSWSPVTVTLGTVNGLSNDLTIGLVRVCTGNAGLLAHRAAPVSCDTSEYCELLPAAVYESGLDDVRNARFSFDLIEWCCVPERWSAAGGCISLPLTNRCGPSSGSLPHRPYDVVRSRSRLRASFSIASAQLYRPQNLAHCSARRPRPVSRMVGDAPENDKTHNAAVYRAESVVKTFIIIIQLFPSSDVI